MLGRAECLRHFLNQSVGKWDGARDPSIGVIGIGLGCEPCGSEPLERGQEVGRDGAGVEKLLEVAVGLGDLSGKVERVVGDGLHGGGTP